MASLSISDVARRLGLRSSAIRYYEQIGILPPAERSSGQRRYDNSVLHRLAIVQRARQVGFTLEEIRELFFGFSDKTAASRRWRELSQKKLAELDLQMGEIRAMQRLLKKMMACCTCETLEQCGRGIFQSSFTLTAKAQRRKVKGSDR
jgi:MerR family redox-sensitive transcriptional activator SoxR